MSNYVLVYDANCAPCRRFKHIVDNLDVYQSIHFISLIKADEQGLLERIPQSIRFKSFHLLSPNGDILSGPEALLELIRVLPLGHVISKFILLVPGGRQLTKALYFMCSRLHDKGSCHIENNHRSSDSTKLGR